MSSSVLRKIWGRRCRVGEGRALCLPKAKENGALTRGGREEGNGIHTKYYGWDNKDAISRSRSWVKKKKVGKR